MENIRHLEENIWQLDLKVDNETEFVAPYLIKAGNSFYIGRYWTKSRHTRTRKTITNHGSKPEKS